MKFQELTRIALPVFHRTMVLLLNLAFACSLQAQTPVAHWTFDEGINDYTSEAIDSANGNDGIWQDDNKDDLGYTTGQIGGAVKLRGGAGNYFTVPSVPQLNGIAATPDFPDTPELGVGITMMAWINKDVGSEDHIQGILMNRSTTDIGTKGTRNNRLWGFSWQPGSTPEYGYTNTRISTQGVDSPDNIFDKGQWHHVALVWGNVDSTADPIPPAQRVYVDGTLVAENSDSGIFELVSNENWWIGNDGCCGNREFEGLVDDVAMFDSALSTTQIQTIYNNGLTGIDAAGNMTGQLDYGDVDGVNGVTIDDFNIIRDNLGKSVAARNMGDLNGDRQVSLNDFQLWLDNAPPPLAALALSIPEPASIALVSLVLVFGGLSRSARGHCLASMLVVLTLGVAATHARAQDLVLKVDRSTGELTLTGADSNAVSLAGYAITSQSGTLAPDNFDGLRNTEADWVLAGLPGANGVQELNSNGDPLAATLIDNSVSFSLGAGYDPGPAILDAGFGVDVEQGDLAFSYYDTALDQTFNGTVQYTGEKIFNNIGIIVNLSDGTAILENESPFDETITGYLIRANTPGTLNTDSDSFNGVGGDFQPPTVLDGDNLGEIDPTGNGIDLNAGASTDLGVIGGLGNDLSFSFLLAGSGQTSRTGFIKYLSVDGDFNTDGRVNGVDFLMWQRGESPNPLSDSDLADWQANYGFRNGSSTAAVSSVPEPASAMLAAAALLGVAIQRRKVRWA